MSEEDYSVQTARAKARQAASFERSQSPEAARYALPPGTMRLAERAAQVRAFVESQRQSLGQAPTLGASKPKD